MRMVGIMAILCPTLAPAHAAEEPKRPDVVLVVADNLGDSGLGCQGPLDAGGKLVRYGFELCGVRFPEGEGGAAWRPRT